MNENLSSYQNPEGQLKDRLAPRTNEVRYKDLSWLDIVKKRTVLDLGCNNGFFTRESLVRGARRAVGVDESNAIIGARELSKGTGAEFWQLDIDSKEFRRFCPKFEVVLLLSVLTHVRDKEEFLDWLDGICTYALVFESNHGEKNKEHIELVKKHFWSESITDFGSTDIPSKPHYLWVIRKHNHEIRYPILADLPVEFVPIDRVIGWDEETILKQDTTYDIHSEEFKKLMHDIKTRGFRKPLTLEDEKDGYFKGFQGGHRYVAAKMLGYKEVPCRIMRGHFVKHLEK
jgi:SAM-dependent methyltransferase